MRDAAIRLRFRSARFNHPCLTARGRASMSGPRQCYLPRKYESCLPNHFILFAALRLFDLGIGLFFDQLGRGIGGLLDAFLFGLEFVWRFGCVGCLIGSCLFWLLAAASEDQQSTHRNQSHGFGSGFNSPS
jgi:hypothetical protein